MLNRRTRRLINPRLQLRLAAVFLGMSALSLLLQTLLFLSVMTRVANRLPSDGSLLLAEVGPMIGLVLLLSFSVLLPLTFLVGLVTTHRWAGPLYRFQVYLGQVARRETSRPCKLRDGDELQEICDLINEVTQPVRAELEAEAEAGADGEAPSPETRAA